MAHINNITASTEGTAKKRKTANSFNLATPDKIKEYLDQYVIGQEEAKKILSVAVYNHYKKILYNNSALSDLEIDKSNVLLLGSTGCGKTLLVKTIARMLGVPCYIQDCTKITASGYVGSDVEDCLVGLLRSCDYNLEAAEHGIVMLDEGDKIARKEAGPSITRDVSGECVQQSLLKIVEGDVVGVPPEGGRKHPEQPLIYVNTTNILFILSGAFVGLEEIIKKRLGSGHIGFTSERTEEITTDNVNEYATPQDIRDFGFIPEFIGRFPIITHVNKLTVEDLIVILKEPKNAIIKQYVELLRMDNVNLTFDDDALEEIAKLTFKLETGARGLRTVTETIMTDIMYEAPVLARRKKMPMEINITAEMVREKTAYKFKNLRKVS